MVKRIIEKNKIKFVPIPEKIAKDVGLTSGSYVEVANDGYRIIITPKQFSTTKDHDYSEEELDKIEKLAREKGGKAFKTGKAFLKYLDQLTKK